MEKEFAKSIIENLLLVSNKPLTVSMTRDVLGKDFPDREIKKLFLELKEFYAERSLQLIEVADGYQLTTRFEYAQWIKRFHKSERASSISNASLETLAIVAYKQPIIRIEVDEIRGVDSGGTIKTLLERGLIRIAGKKKVIGRPIMYATTRKFLECLGLQNLSDLPTLKEFDKNELGDIINETEREKQQLSFQFDDDKASESNFSSGNSIASSGGADDSGRIGDGERQDCSETGSES